MIIIHLSYLAFIERTQNKEGNKPERENILEYIIWDNSENIMRMGVSKNIYRQYISSKSRVLSIISNNAQGYHKPFNITM